MANLEELAGLINGNVDNEGLRSKVLAAAQIKANLIIAELSPSAPRLAWAQGTLQNPNSATDELYHFAIAANNTATIGNITGAIDSDIQDNVNTAVEKLYP